MIRPQKLTLQDTIEKKILNYLHDLVDFPYVCSLRKTAELFIYNEIT